MSQNKKKTIVIDGVRYHADRPASCKDCYFWKNNKTGCVLGKDNCYYLAETPKKTKCDGCPYAKGRPCVTLACYRELDAMARRWHR
ncbi:MAG: hypothetical protein LUH07_16075 [Lachnospiraceae bacterium]|nr:hypothetical protein [Lachnospiraceae bacterium]